MSGAISSRGRRLRRSRPHSVILWTRRPFAEGKRQRLTVEVAEDEAFRQGRRARAGSGLGAADWTARVLVGGLKPARRLLVSLHRRATETAAASAARSPLRRPDDPRRRELHFRQLPERQRRKAQRLSPDDLRRRTRCGRAISLASCCTSATSSTRSFNIRKKERRAMTGRSTRSAASPTRERPAISTGRKPSTAIAPSGRAISPIPTCRTPAHAGRSSACGTITNSRGRAGRASSSRAARRSPARPSRSPPIRPGSNTFRLASRRRAARSTEFGKVAVKNVKIDKWDENGLGHEPNNLAAIRSLIAYRAFRYGKHLDLIITDQRSFCGEDPQRCRGGWKDLRPVVPRLLFGGSDDRSRCRAKRMTAESRPPNSSSAMCKFRTRAKRSSRGRSSASSRRHGSRTSCASRRRRGRSGEIRSALSTTAWTCKTFPPEWRRIRGRPTLTGWPAATITAAAYAERKEIYDLVRDAKITGFAIVSGDRHAFWAGYAAAHLPPRKFEPVGLSFVGASMISPGAMEAFEHGLRKDHPLRALFLADRPGGGKPEWTYNMLLRHGVRSCLEYAKSFDLKRARRPLEPAACAAPRVRRPGRPRLREGAPHRR